MLWPHPSGYRRRLQRGHLGPRGAEGLRRGQARQWHPLVGPGLWSRQSGRRHDAGPGPERKWTAAYIDTLSEAQKVLVDQLSGALFPIADDVKIQIEFNPRDCRREYRLIGYETRALKREDFNNDRIDAGEIGAGHQVTAPYEVTPAGSVAVLNDPLRYGAAQDSRPAEPSGDLAWLKLRYKDPGQKTSNLIETPVSATPAEGDGDACFAAAIADGPAS
ncbi:MAG: DUF3520 domain-containing protein [Paracoccaceae bacterium]